MQDYSTKSQTYFSGARREIEPLLPPKADRVLDLGCGSGGTLAWLKTTGRARHAVGIEIFPAAAQQARQVANEVLCLDFERDAISADLGRFDLILCLDVLEHLVDPWKAVDRLVRDFLDAGGTIIVSVPNVRHHSVLLPLALGGRWDYASQGLLDRTHLRFFTRDSALQLLEHPMLRAARCLRPGFDRGSAKSLFNAVSLGLFREFLAFHYVVAAVKLPSAKDAS